LQAPIVVVFLVKQVEKNNNFVLSLPVFSVNVYLWKTLTIYPIHSSVHSKEDSREERKPQNPFIDFDDEKIGKHKK
jgi:hypothetical protein